MAAYAFGVTAATVYSLHFPAWGAPSASGKPTAAAVAIMVSQSSGVLATKLYKEGVDAAAITDAATAAYLTCAEQLGRMVALKVLKVSTQKMPELAKELAAEIAAWFDELNKDAATHLGDTALNGNSSPANGPTSHVSEYSLEQLAGEDMSDVIPPLKKSDRL